MPNLEDKPNDNIRRMFKALTSREPFPWQEEQAFPLLAAGKIPPTVSLPTGTGKTSLIAIWLTALAYQAARGSITLPRRLVWVVNRRVVVDQATEEADRMVRRINFPEECPDEAEREILEAIRADLMGISFIGTKGGAPVAVSTLRGEHADNGDWKLDPSRPAIIVGTVDMIGSRLLFSGYGDGKYKRPSHAGLLGQDAWIVLDEAHLTPAFAHLLAGIRAEQAGFPHLLPFHCTCLSATQRRLGDGEPLGLTPADENHPVIGIRLNASKKLRLHELADKEDESEKLVECALAYQGKPVRLIVFVKSPKIAAKVSERIRRDVPNCEILTGTLRGLERDALAKKEAFAGFRSDPKRQPPTGTHILVSTAAGEVGADLDADHMVCDLSSLDSLIQRFGRVNRLGLGDAVIDLVLVAKAGKEEVKPEEVLAYLKSLPRDAAGLFDVSPNALKDAPITAFADAPPVVPLARHWLDMWSLTSIPGAAWPERPEVAPWLHGVVDELPETWAVWREDIRWLGDPKEVSGKDCEKVFDVYPIQTQERLREPTRDILDKLKKLSKLRDNGTCRIVLLRADGSVDRPGTLGEFLADDAKSEIRLRFSTVLLPVAAGGLSESGIFEPSEPPASDTSEKGNRQRKRFLARGNDEGWEAFSSIDGIGEPAYVDNTLEKLSSKIAKATGLKLVARVPLGPAKEEQPSEDERRSYLLYFTDNASAAESTAVSYIAPETQTVEEHNRRVGAVAAEIAKRLGLEDFREAFGTAGQGHDMGKARSCWQRAIGNNELDKPLAKTNHARFNPLLNAGFRHEFGSLLDAAAKLAEDHPHRDLILHGIASHHGYARPHFTEKGQDDKQTPIRLCRQTALEAVRRFGRLQARYGWWGLAYLEALLKAADVLVSVSHDRGGNHE